MLIGTALEYKTFSAKLKNYFCFFFILLACIISYLYIDRPLTEFMTKHVKNSVFGSLIMLTNFGDGLGYLLSFGSLFVFCKLLKINKWTPKFFFIFLSLVTTGILCFLAKIVIARYRPDAYLNQHLYGFHFFSMTALQQSFPSGHTVTITTLMVALAILFPRYRILFFIIMIAISLSRVLLHQHYLSDVMMSMYLTSLVVIWISAQREKTWFLMVTGVRSSLDIKSPKLS